MLTPERLVKPSSARLISEAATYGATVAWGRRALNCSQRCPLAERMSVFESSSPRFCFNPRSMASRNESDITAGTSLAGTLPANELTPCVPGMVCPGMEGGAVCPNDASAQQPKAPAIRKARNAIRPRRSLKAAPLT